MRMMYVEQMAAEISASEENGPSGFGAGCDCNSPEGYCGGDEQAKRLRGVVASIMGLGCDSGFDRGLPMTLRVSGWRWSTIGSGSNGVWLPRLCRGRGSTGYSLCFGHIWGRVQGLAKVCLQQRSLRFYAKDHLWWDRADGYSLVVVLSPIPQA